MTVRQLLANLDSKELSEWIAYFNLPKDEKGKANLDTQFRNALRSRKKKF